MQNLQKTTIAMQAGSFDIAPPSRGQRALPGECGRSRRQPARCRRIASTVLLFGVILATCHVGVTESVSTRSKGGGANAWAIKWQPAKLVNGSPVVFQVVPPTRLTGLTAKWLEHE